MAKTSDRLAEIRARVARHGAQQEPQPGGAEPSPPATAAPQAEPGAPPEAAALNAASAHFLGIVGQLTQGRSITRAGVGQIAPDERPEMRQPRLLPPPDQLIVNGEPAPEYRALVGELLELGRSLRDHQIQPIIIYRGESSAYPAARYLILVGHRRWTAATLVGLETLEAIVVEPPDATERVRVQYAENEAREEFSDMERAWALLQMKGALGDAPWEAVEAQFQISRSRRHELARLLAFTQTQQRQIALLRMQETQIRPLHTALRSGDLSESQVDAVLSRLSQIAAERAATGASAPRRGGEANAPRRRAGIDGPTVARLVAREQRAGSPARAAEAPAPRWLAPLREQIQRTSQSVRRAAGRAAALSSADTTALRAEVDELARSLTDLSRQLQDSGSEEAR